VNVTERWNAAQRGVWMIVLCLFAAGCSVTGSCSSTGGGGIGGVSVDVGSSGPATGGLAIDFRSEPDPPKSGSNALQVVVKDAEGKPVNDASVKVVFSMPAMPSMNMPAMRTETTLAPEADGRYKGTGDLSMAGTWNVAVTVSRGAEELGTRKLSIVAK
jgi:hypothetical protein